MRLDQAIALIELGVDGIRGPTTWADLGCGSGAFTLALADLLPPGSTIHAMDLDATALAELPASRHDIRIHAWRGDFLEDTWPFDGLDGILMANALHYARDQQALVRRCATRMRAEHRFLIVEYDTDTANSWVPYPLGQRALRSLFNAAGYSSIHILGARPSMYNRARLYSALVRSPGATAREVTER